VRATRPTCYIPLDSVMPIILTIKNIQFHSTRCPVFHFFLSLSLSLSLSLDTDSTMGSVSAKPAIASLCLLHTCLHSVVDNSQLYNMYIVKRTYGSNVCKACQLPVLSSLLFMRVCCRSRLSSNTYIGI
jgi:hypothetical protein